MYLKFYIHLPFEVSNSFLNFKFHETVDWTAITKIIELKQLSDWTTTTKIKNITSFQGKVQLKDF